MKRVSNDVEILTVDYLIRDLVSLRKQANRLITKEAEFERFGKIVTDIYYIIKICNQKVVKETIDFLDFIIVDPHVVRKIKLTMFGNGNINTIVVLWMQDEKKKMGLFVFNGDTITTVKIVDDPGVLVKTIEEDYMDDKQITLKNKRRFEITKF